MAETVGSNVGYDGGLWRSLHGGRFAVAMWVLFLVLSGLMILDFFLFRSWGVGTFPSVDRHVLRLTAMGVFSNTPLTDADGLPTFLQYARSPVGRLLHIAPAAAWSIIAPFQLSPTMRSKYRSAHRWLGRIFIGMSVFMTVGILPLVFGRLTKVHFGVVEGGAVLVTTAYFLLTALLAIHHARAGRLALHRLWILRHIAVGYASHLQRLMGLSWKFLGSVVPGYNDHTEAGSDLRGRIFMTYFWVAIAVSVGSMEVWLHHSSYSSSSLGNRWKGKYV